MSRRLAAVIDTIQRDYHNDPSLESEAARRDRVRTLTQLRDRMAAEAWEAARVPGSVQSGTEAVAAVQVELVRAEDEIIMTEIIGQLPDRAVHDHFARQAGLLLDGEIPVMPECVYGGYKSAQYWREQLAARQIEPEVHLRGEEPFYHEVDPIEDVALPPRVIWSATDHAAALEKVATQHRLEPGQWIELEWPPRASLWSEGYAYRTTFEPCEPHAELDDRDEADESVVGECDDCIQPDWFVEVPATWNFTAEMTRFEVAFDHAGEEQHHEVERDSVEVFQYSELDPAQIVIGTWRARSMTQ
ncbi:hypothetical protein BOX37_26340 [Nocardia mangyaensis]|uniref:Uncharacterized protein n=1 Tax=Nocardia mangyaensis TaxID=2213200 RepID=A0A1J0VXT0_9NOCA|nr:hypothetical protein [Nocardia mangyaensis]APE36867.1 hypothetical protein BOX37_26340 [Nocardia mangyaensis]